MSSRSRALLVAAAVGLAIGTSQIVIPSALAESPAGPEDATQQSQAQPSPDAALPSEAVPTASPSVGEPPLSEPTSSASAPVPPPAATTDAPTVDPSPHLSGDVAPDGHAVDEGTPEGDGGHGGDGGGHGGEANLPAGVVVTVDGRDISATDPAGSLPKIAGCAFDIAATGLSTNPPTTVGVKVVAWPPSVPEGQKTKLVDDASASSDGTWSGTYSLDDQVTDLSRKANGYHMRLEIWLDSAMGAMKMYWLGCGEPQTGNPRRVLFETVWRTADGTPVAGPLNASLPRGWRGTFSLHAASERGTANCGYPVGSDVMVCTYDNPGHGGAPGLVIPGKPGTEYEVSVTGAPQGWRLDGATVGVFDAESTCPKGSHGDSSHGDSGHGEEAAARSEGEDGEAAKTCTHVVALDQRAPSTPPTDGGGSSGGATPPSTDNGDVAGRGGTLPVTGARVAETTSIAVVLLLAGAALLAVSRGRRPLRKGEARG